MSQRYERLLDELRRFREREPLVQALAEAASAYKYIAVMEVTDRGNAAELALSSTLKAVLGFCISGASTDVASEANAAGSSGSEPAE